MANHGAIISEPWTALEADAKARRSQWDLRKRRAEATAVAEMGGRGALNTTQHFEAMGHATRDELIRRIHQIEGWFLMVIAASSIRLDARSADEALRALCTRHASMPPNYHAEAARARGSQNLALVDGFTAVDQAAIDEEVDLANARVQKELHLRNETLERSAQIERAAIAAEKIANKPRLSFRGLKDEFAKGGAVAAGKHFVAYLISLWDDGDLGKLLKVAVVILAGTAIAKFAKIMDFLWPGH